jgi:hypothetical protein
VVQGRVQGPPASVRIYEGRIKDARSAWGVLILTMRTGREMGIAHFDIREARIVGPSGAEWKGEDLRIGDRVRVTLAADGRLVQQVRKLPD